MSDEQPTLAPGLMLAFNPEESEESNDEPKK